MAGDKLYSSLKAFHYADRLQTVSNGGVPAPIHIRIKPTNTCNHNCWYCAYRADQLELGGGMTESDAIPEAKMFEIVNDLIAMDVKAVTFSGGGEPLLYKPLPEVIERLSAAGVKIGCLTNGANLKGRFAEALAKHGSWVRISIDAWDDDSYVASRGAKAGAFTKLMDNIRAFQDRASDCVLGISLIIGKDNHQRIFEVCTTLKQAGVQHVKLSAAVVSNDVHENNAYHEPLIEGVSEQIQQTEILADAHFQVVNHFHTLSERFDKPYASCPSVKLMTVIGADQSVYTCQDKAYTVAGALGSIEHTTFKSFWFSEANRKRLESINPNRDCRHHCVSHAKNTTLWEYLNLNEDHVAFI